jgi:hypothetical protein
MSIRARRGGRRRVEVYAQHAISEATLRREEKGVLDTLAYKFIRNVNANRGRTEIVRVLWRFFARN